MDSVENDQPFQSVVHPTDFSLADEVALAHAIRLSVAARSALHILHVEDERAARDWARFPDVAELLKRWKLLAPGAPPEATEAQLGVKLFKASMKSEDVVGAISSYAELHHCDFLVLMTHESSWMRRIFRASLAEATARHVHAPALFLREDEAGFVKLNTGDIRINRVFMPVAADVSPMHAWGVGSKFVRSLAPLAEFQLIHVGETLPTFGNLLPHIELKRGPVVETILEVAEDLRPDLIVMATDGHHEIFDEVRGSTTEQVLRRAPCPVLAVPTKQRD
ncbi:MAG TPA: universal stress protein [Methylocystis sp.]|nr:universal stress protein [Methylocystis sp.]